MSWALKAEATHPHSPLSLLPPLLGVPRGLLASSFLSPDMSPAAFGKVEVPFLEALVPHHPKRVTQGPQADSAMFVTQKGAMQIYAGDCHRLSKERQMACPLPARKQNVGWLTVPCELWIGTTHHYGLAMTSKSSTTELQERLSLAYISHQDD